MPSFQRTSRLSSPPDANDDLEPIPGLMYSDAELASSLQHQITPQPASDVGRLPRVGSHPQQMSQPKKISDDVEPPPRISRTRSRTPVSDRPHNRSRRRSPTPNSMTIDPFVIPSTPTRHIDMPASTAGSSHNRYCYDSDLYADSDEDSGDNATNLGGKVFSVLILIK